MCEKHVKPPDDPLHGRQKKKTFAKVNSQHNTYYLHVIFMFQLTYCVRLTYDQENLRTFILFRYSYIQLNI